MRRRPDHTTALFLKRTIAAQIHLVGFFLACVGLALLLYRTWSFADPLQFWACATFGLTAMLVFGVSATYHTLSDGLEISPRLDRIFEDLDHFSIYLFIAGTYTPVLLTTLQGPFRIPMLVLIWLIAICGIGYTHVKPKLPRWMQHRYFATGIFVAKGWVALLRIGAVVAGLSNFAFAMLALGAFSYTAGAVVYASKRPILFKDIFGFHELWHVMVLAGFVFHYLMILSFYS